MPPKKKLNDSTDEPPAKRTRSSLSAKPTDDAFEDIKSSDLWFLDGTVVIAVTDTEAKKRHLFKVHKCVLTSHSPIWRDIFDLPQAPSTSRGDSSEDTFEGLPLIVFPDAASDVEDLFCLIYMKRHIPHEILKADTVEKVAGALRLSTKYDIEHLRKRIISTLALDWPKKLCDWDDLEKDINHVLTVKQGKTGMDKHLPEPAALIRIATECNVLSVLPAAFYHLSRVYWGTPPGPDYLPTASVSTVARTAKVEILEATDLGRLIVGREGLRADVLGFLYRIKFSPDDAHISTCKLTKKTEPDVWQCKYRLREWWTTYAIDNMLNPDEDEHHPINFYDPLAYLKQLAKDITDWKPNPKRVCSRCLGWVADEIRAERSKIWKFLPQRFRIEDAWVNDEDSSSESESESESEADDSD